MSGRCTATTVVTSVVFGELTIPCPCPSGKFDVPLSTLDVICKVCTHPLSQHEDADSSTAQGSSSQLQSMSPSSFHLNILIATDKHLVGFTDILDDDLKHCQC